MNLGAFILVSVPLAIQYFASKYRQDDFTRTLEEMEADLAVPRIKLYDFIVVGGGCGGSTVAGRLSEHFSVLLLEAGGTPPPASDVPGFRHEVAADTDTNIFFSSIPQPGAAGRVLTVSEGKMLGGSGSHNGMSQNRGNPRDYDNWASLTGDPSWRYDNVLQYFKKAENFIGVLFDEGEEDAYGHEGPLHVDTYLNPFLPLWLAAGVELGYKVSDPNGRQKESFTPTNAMVYQGKRVSAYTGYIRPFEGVRANLTVLRYSDVEEILLDDQSRAFGVAYWRHGIAQRAYAAKEVIISGGWAQSPLLLMKSGVGPADMLEEAGIPVRVELPGVGRNLQDHIFMRLRIYLNDTSLLGRIGDGDEGELERYHETGEGLLGEPFTAGLAFLVSSRAKEAGEGDWPDIAMQQYVRPNGVVPSEDGREATLMIVALTRPRQRGWLRLNGTAWRAGERDDTKLAITDLQHLSDLSDVEVTLEGLKVGLAAMEDTEAFRAVGAMYPAEPHPECLDHWYRSDEYWRCHIRHTASSWNHRGGTCAMGRPEDPMAVVDSQLRVIGVQSLRVVDASVIPVLANSGTLGSVVMIGEKAAAEILRTHGVTAP